MAARDDVTATVCVRNLNYSTTPEILGNEFNKFGTIKEARVITRNFRGRVQSQGYGFVQFENPESKEKAVAASPMQIDGRNVIIVAARTPIKTLFLFGIQENVTEEQVKAVYPKAVSIKILPPRPQRRGYAFVEFATTEDFQTARATRFVQIGGANVRVEGARSRGPIERKTAFITPVPEGVTDEQIMEKFPKSVSVRRPRQGSYAFVNFENNNDLMAAIKDVREIQIGETTIKVRIARSIRRGGPRRFRRSGPRRFRRGGPRRSNFRRAPKKSGRTKPKTE